MVQKKIMMLACVLMCAATAVMSAPATTPYFCDFENEAENSQWVSWAGATVARMKHSTWKTGGAAFFTGEKGMYISDLDIDAVGGNTHSYPKTSGYTVSAYRKMTLAAGDYLISLDYKCPTELLSVSLIQADTLDASTIQTQTGADYATVVKNSIVTGMRDMKSTKWSHVAAQTQVATAGTYLLAVTYRTSSGPDLDFGAAVDNVEVIKVQDDDTACDYALSGLSFDFADGNATLTWNGNADEYEVRIYFVDGTLVVNDTVNTESFTLNMGNVEPGTYTFWVRGLGCNDNGANTGWATIKERLGAFSGIADACPEVTLPSHEIINGVKYLTPTCDADGRYLLKPTVVAGGGAIDGYRVDPIQYNECPFPFEYQLASMMMGMGTGNYLRRITTDDVWDNQALTLPFKVCFFDNTYSQAVVCSNGIVSFEPSVAGKSAGYALGSQPDIPSPQFGQAQGTGMYWRNAIYGVFQDYDPYYGGEIWYGVLGTFPCRKMVVTWNSVPMFNNHTTINSSMIVMYEGTNVIDVYVKNRDLSPTGWNDNRGIVGLQNADGTDGVAAPGRNTTDGDQNGRSWSAHNEAWRFTPYAPSAYTLTWYKGAFADTTALETYMREHPEENIVLSTTADSMIVSEADGINAVTVRMQYSQCNGDFIDVLDYAYINWPHADTIKIDTVACHGTVYSDHFVERADGTGLYEVSIPDQFGCDSIIYKLNLTVLPKDTMVIDTILCSGETLDFAGVQTNVPGTYPVTLKYANCDCDSLVKIITLSALEPLQVDVQADQTVVCGDDPVITLSYNVVSGRADKFDFIFDEEAQAAGFENLTDQPVGSGAEISIPIMEEGARTFKRPGTYTALLTFFDKSECTDQTYNLQFDVLYPSSMIFQRWDDVLSVTGPDVNGGYEFVAYQWLKDGEPIKDAEKSYYYAPEKLVIGSEYQVLLTDANGKQIITCPFIPKPSANPVSIAPNTVRTGEQVMVTVPEDTRVDFYSVSGFRMSTATVASGSTMVHVPNTAGVYVVQLSMGEGTRSFRITVTE